MKKNVGKKMMSVLMVIMIVCSLMATSAFAATSGEPMPTPQPPMPQTEISIPAPDVSTWDTYADTKTGLLFSYPEDWSLSVAKQKTYTTTGDPIIRRTISLTSPTGMCRIKLTTLNVASLDIGPKYLVSVNNETLYYVSSQQAMTVVSDDSFVRNFCNQNTQKEYVTAMTYCQYILNSVSIGQR